MTLKNFGLAVFTISFFFVEIQGSLFGRQSSTGVTSTPTNIPQSCQGICNVIIDTINTCATFQCLCTPENSNNLTSCVDCISAIKPNETVIEEAQGILNQFGAICNNAGGIPIPTQTASGFSGVVGSPGASTVQSSASVSGGVDSSSPIGPSSILSGSLITSSSPSLSQIPASLSQSGSAVPLTSGATTTTGAPAGAPTNGAALIPLNMLGVAAAAGMGTMFTLMFV
ncbi:hypothetical protein Moror_11472 [Moniliophthora roreri MCA 2997]|uniref:Extracellular membrane protein CFEM domain-containing protein n=1 Tax=Moniliophthora roreri (strain MCA 2997) TaxID=1381753 RepID=V2WB86_MONRO|nr:hypothetical protein Moror_11472 [Moniliophthora roreri MCA 2997]